MIDGMQMNDIFHVDDCTRLQSVAIMLVPYMALGKLAFIMTPF